MGKLTTCDDAKSNLKLDWDPRDYTVFTCPNEYSFAIQKNVDPISVDMVAHNTSFDPRKDEVVHKCMDTVLQYDELVPIRGDHRPNWAKYGEYLYVPVQRWLHNLEHGAVVMLYHPCANQYEVNSLREILTSCLYRHVITPYNKLSHTRPIALVSWGARIEMNYVDEEQVVAFIKKFARRAPEDISRNGLYDQFLVRPAQIISDENDSNICVDYRLGH
ncbi:unnamed protein product [Caenorhabditis auriculariae]|uniref:Uncharacterized protein n=1 Tax=Caenorhabditis auriculariae TaxID=2777116 RepID=A0A8S1HQM5_9PELO|nr:unnamed protein product [Caenorhabditis auriculariae]